MKKDVLLKLKSVKEDALDKASLAFNKRNWKLESEYMDIVQMCDMLIRLLEQANNKK